jgi:hypothetical protein
MIDLPIGKALIVEESDDTCNKCVWNDLGRCNHIICAKDERADGKNMIFRIIDLPRPVDVTPLLDALKKCQLFFDKCSKLSGEGITWEQYAEQAQVIAAVLEKWEADHARD